LRYKVILSSTAHAEAERYAEFIRERSNDDEASNNWWNGLLDAIFSPNAYPAAILKFPIRSNQAGCSANSSTHRTASSSKSIHNTSGSCASTTAPKSP
jgi:hypothetical protein